MATPQIDRFAESSLFKVSSAVLTAVLTAAVLGVGGSLVDRLGRVEAQLADAREARATMELRLKALEKDDIDHAAALSRLGDKALMLEFKVEDLQRVGTGRR